MSPTPHFSAVPCGKPAPPVVEGLVRDLAAHRPDLLVVSGDFTQRARHGQYQEAAAFLKRLPTPQLVVPGNHDIPMYDWGFIPRFVAPLRNYRRYISTDLRPAYQDEELIVLGINSARSFTQKSGWISEEQLLDVKLRVCPLPKTVFKV